MGKYVLQGGTPIQGEVRVQGAKNAVLPILAGAILNQGLSYIYDCPKILDVNTMVKILVQLGCKVHWEENCLVIDSSTIDQFEVAEKLVTEMRSSIILLGAMIARHKKVVISYPGGCSIGHRPIDLHLKALKQLGIHIREKNGFIICTAEEIKGAKITLDFPSVGATENIMLAASLANGVTTIYNPAKEPEIIDLQNFLNKMGANIQGAGSNIIVIEGVKEVKDVKYRIIPDRIVAGTYLIAAAITGGEIVLHNVDKNHLCPLLAKLREMGCSIIEEPDTLILQSPENLHAVDVIRTQPYPGFPTDLQAQMMSLLTVANGTSIISETIFESRYKHAEGLIRMGANINIEGRTAIIQGVSRLSGAQVYARDLRGGAALILAGLNAEGETVVHDSYHVERGYESIEKDLSSVGANIQLIR